jgi:hypothetical protein
MISTAASSGACRYSGHGDDHRLATPFRRRAARVTRKDHNPKSRIEWPAVSDSSVRVRCFAKTVSRRVDEEDEEAKICT